MTKKKKKKESMLDAYTPAFATAGVSVGSSVIGGKLQSSLPAGTPNAFTTIGSSTSHWVAPMATLGSAGIATKQLKKLIKDMKKLD